MSSYSSGALRVRRDARKWGKDADSVHLWSLEEDRWLVKRRHVDGLSWASLLEEYRSARLMKARSMFRKAGLTQQQLQQRYEALQKVQLESRFDLLLGDVALQQRQLELRREVRRAARAAVAAAAEEEERRRGRGRRRKKREEPEEEEEPLETNEERLSLCFGPSYTFFEGNSDDEELPGAIDDGDDDDDDDDDSDGDDGMEGSFRRRRFDADEAASYDDDDDDDGGGGDGRKSAADSSIGPSALSHGARLYDSSERRRQRRLRRRRKAAEVIEVHVSGRRLVPTVLKGRKEALMAQSRVIRNAIAAARVGSVPSGSLLRHRILFSSKEARLYLSDGDPVYDGLETYNHMAGEVVEKLLLFAEDPQMLQRCRVLEERVAALEAQRDEAVQAIRAGITRLRETHVGKLKQDMSDERRHVRTALEKALADDIAQLHASHRRALQVEEAKLRAKFDHRIADLQSFFDEELSWAAAMQQRAHRRQIRSAQHDVARLRQQVDEVLEEETIVRLLILCEDLEAVTLRNTVIDRLTSPGHFLNHAERNELACPLLHESTVRDLIQRLGDADVAQLCQLGSDSFVHHAMAVRELQNRRIIARDQLRRATNEQLRALVASDDYVFPELLTAELSTRHIFSTVSLRSLTPHALRLTADGCNRATLHAPFVYATLLATQARRAGQFGKWMFEVHVRRMASPGGEMYIGWDVPRDDTAAAAAAAAAAGGTGGHAERGHLLGSWSELPAGAAPLPAALDLDALLSSGFGDEDAVIPGLTAMYDDEEGLVRNGYSWQSNGGDGFIHTDDGRPLDCGIGVLHAWGGSQADLPNYVEGDVVACLLDQDCQPARLSWAVNGKRVLPEGSSADRAAHDRSPAFASFASAAAVAASASATSSKTEERSEGKGADGSEGDAVGVPVQHADSYALLPAVCMYSLGEEMEVDVRFSPPFAFAIDGYEGYGEKLA